MGVTATSSLPIGLICHTGFSASDNSLFHLHYYKIGGRQRLTQLKWVFQLGKMVELIFFAPVF